MKSREHAPLPIGCNYAMYTFHMLVNLIEKAKLTLSIE